MNDRIPTQPNRVKITKSDGSSEYVTWERADEPTQEGTPLNKATFFTNANATRFNCDLPSEAFTRLTTEWSVAVPLSSWSSTTTDGWYTNQITVSGMKAVYNPVATVIVTSASTVNTEISDFSKIQEIETYDGYIICRATVVPSASLNIRLSGV